MAKSPSDSMARPRRQQVQPHPVARADCHGHQLRDAEVSHSAAGRPEADPQARPRERMSFLRRIEVLEPGKNPILSDIGLSFGKDMTRIVAHILGTSELHLYVDRVLPTAIAQTPDQRLPRKRSAFDTAAPERRMAAERDAVLQAQQDRLSLWEPWDLCSASILAAV
jgi:hypothetical protein